MEKNWNKVMFVFILILIMSFAGILMLQNREQNELDDYDNNNVNEVFDNVDQENNNLDNNEDVTNGEDENFETEVVVNSVVDANDKLSFNEYGKELVIEVINGEVKIGDITRKINNEKIVSITGYYYQPGGVTHLFALTESKKVYVLSYDVFFGIDDRQFKPTDLTNVEKLVLYDVCVYYAGSQVDERNRVYAVSLDKEIQIDSYCVLYNDLEG